MQSKSAAVIARRFVTITSGRAKDYEEGVKAPRRDWLKETKDAEGRYEEGIKDAIKRKAFGKGVDKCGTARQQQKTIEKGVPVFADRVLLAEDDMRIAMEPVVAVLERTSLPPKYPRGDPRNIERVKTVDDALHKLKTG